MKLFPGEIRSEITRSRFVEDVSEQPELHVVLQGLAAACWCCRPVDFSPPSDIMLKLKERLKQQRALASSSSASGSNDTSLADTSSSLAPPPALPPRQPLTGDFAPSKPRKVAAAHPAPGYR
ncbi:hypothetical protein RRG08_037257, partial [Elysia crispata]